MSRKNNKIKHLSFRDKFSFFKEELSEMPWYFFIGFFILFLFTIAIIVKINKSDQSIFSLGIFFLILGVVFQTYNKTNDFKLTLSVVFLAYIFSLCVFIPSKKENIYSFERHIQDWFYLFCLFVIAFATKALWDKILPKLTEGVTLLQSVALIYLGVEMGNSSDYFYIFLMICLFSSPFIFFSIYNAFTDKEITKKNRLFLSVWSSFLTLLFASINIYTILSRGLIETQNVFSTKISLCIDYFFLGISSVYFAQNLILAFYFFNKKEIERIELRNEHIARFSENQVRILDSTYAIIFSITIFSINHLYGLVPKITAIWFVFATFPLLINLIHSINLNRHT